LLSDPGASKTLASYAQRSQWLFAVRFPRAHLNEMVITWRLQGALSAAALEAAVGDLVARHPTLRARLSYEHGQLYQIVMPAQPVPLQFTQAHGGSPEARLEAAKELLASPERKPLDLIAGPTLVADLVQVDPQDHLLCLRVHHAMCDGWSIGVMQRDLLAMYEARLQGAAAALAPVAMQYGEVAAWEVSTYESGGFEADLRYWRAELAEPPPPLRLPVTGERKGNRDWLEHVVSREARDPAGADLLAFARSLRASPFSLFLAVLAAMTFQRTGQQDQLFGVPTLNRWSEEALGFVGYATSMLPIRVRPSPDLAFDKLVAAVQASSRKMLVHGRVPLEILLREAALPKAGNTVFPVWCQYLEAETGGAASAAGLQVTLVQVGRPNLLAELDVDIQGSTHGPVTFDFGYRTSLFEAAAMHAFADDYLAVLKAARLAPQSRLADLLPATARG